MQCLKVVYESSLIDNSNTSVSKKNLAFVLKESQTILPLRSLADFQDSKNEKTLSFSSVYSAVLNSPLSDLTWEDLFEEVMEIP